MRGLGARTKGPATAEGVVLDGVAGAFDLQDLSEKKVPWLTEGRLQSIVDHLKECGDVVDDC